MRLSCSWSSGPSACSSCREGPADEQLPGVAPLLCPLPSVACCVRRASALLLECKPLPSGACCVLCASALLLECGVLGTGLGCFTFSWVGDSCNYRIRITWSIFLGVLK